MNKVAKKIKLDSTQKGSVVLLVVMILAGILIVSLGASTLISRGIKTGSTQSKSTVSYFAAETGIERYMEQYYKDGEKPASDGVVYDEIELTNGAKYTLEYERDGEENVLRSYGYYGGATRFIEKRYPDGNECGNGVVEESEQCDDGNLDVDDGCSDICEVESGWSCSGEPSECEEQIQNYNGVVDGGEECDDGNFFDNDGCTNGIMDDGFRYSVVEYQGFVFNGDWRGPVNIPAWQASKVWPDGSRRCLTSHYVMSRGWVYTQWWCKIIKPSAYCGNHFVEGHEQCDDGNSDSGDGCDEHCQLEGVSAYDWQVGDKWRYHFYNLSSDSHQNHGYHDCLANGGVSLGCGFGSNGPIINPTTLYFSNHSHCICELDAPAEHVNIVNNM